MQKLTLRLATVWMAALPQLAGAWGFFGQDDLVESALKRDEYQRLNIKAGWPDDNPQRLLFEISNRMDVPIQCVGAAIELKDGKSINKSFSPKVFVPAKAQRTGSVQEVLKGTMKDYAVLCTCFRKQGKGACVNPL